MGAVVPFDARGIIERRRAGRGLPFAPSPTPSSFSAHGHRLKRGGGSGNPRPENLLPLRTCQRALRAFARITHTFLGNFGRFVAPPREYCHQFHNNSRHMSGSSAAATLGFADLLGGCRWLHAGQAPLVKATLKRAHSHKGLWIRREFVGDYTPSSRLF